MRRWESRGTCGIWGRGEGRGRSQARGGGALIAEFWISSPQVKFCRVPAGGSKQTSPWKDGSGMSLPLPPVSMCPNTSLSSRNSAPWSPCVAFPHVSGDLNFRQEMAALGVLRWHSPCPRGLYHLPLYHDSLSDKNVGQSCKRSPSPDQDTEDTCVLSPFFLSHQVPG